MAMLDVNKMRKLDAKCSKIPWHDFRDYTALKQSLSRSSNRQQRYERGTKEIFNMDRYKNIFTYQILRLASFNEQQNIFKKVSCPQLALTGFFYTLTIGEIQCFSCDFRINILQEDVNPLVLHACKRMKCLHLQGLDERNVPFGSFTVGDMVTADPSTYSPTQGDLNTDGDTGSTEQSDSGLDVEQDSQSRNSNEEIVTDLSSQRSTEVSYQNQTHENGVLLSGQLATRNTSRPIHHFLSANSTRPLETRTQQTADRRHRNLSRPIPIPDYRYELCRLQSFRAWPSNAAANPEDVANAGFYYLGFDDRVQCYICQGKLRSWEPEDRPLAEHMRHFPQCPFLVGPQSAGNVPLGEEGEDLFQSVLRTQHEDQGSTNEMPELLAKGIVSNRPLHPARVQMSQRLATFTDYPSNAFHKPEDLARAGYFYTGVVDEVRCYFCNVSIRNWKPSEDPWIQHAVRSPKCGFLTMSKGETFIARAKTEQRRYRRRTMVKAAQGAIHKVSDKHMEQVMSSRVVRSVLEMEYKESLVRKVVRRRLKEVGQEFPNSESLIDSINEFEEEPESAESSESEAEDSGNATGSNVISSLKMLKVKDESTTSNEDAGTLEETNQSLREETRCKVCLDEQACIVFLKCGHLVCCSSCAPEMTKCPVCRQNILGTIRVDKDI